MVDSIIACHDGAQFGAVVLGDGILPGVADDREGLARQHRIGVAAAGFDGDEVDLHVLEIAFGHGDVERQISGRMDRLSHQELARRPGRSDAADRGGSGRRDGGCEKPASVHGVLLFDPFASDDANTRVGKGALFALATRATTHAPLPMLSELAVLTPGAKSRDAGATGPSRWRATLPTLRPPTP